MDAAPTMPHTSIITVIFGRETRTWSVVGVFMAISFRAVGQRSYETPGATLLVCAATSRLVPRNHEFVPDRRCAGRKRTTIALRWRPMRRLENPSPRRFAGGLSRRQFFGVVCLFWLYVAVSNVLYAYGMRTGIAHMTNVPLFAPWEARLLQHLLLLPFLLISYWASLRIQWRPAPGRDPPAGHSGCGICRACLSGDDRGGGGVRGYGTFTTSPALTCRMQSRVGRRCGSPAS